VAVRPFAATRLPYIVFDLVSNHNRVYRNLTGFQWMDLSTSCQLLTSLMPPRSVERSPAQTSPDFFSAQVRDAQRFYLDLAPARDAELTVVCGGRERSAPDYHIHRKSFPYYSIEFVAGGAGEMILAGQRVELAPGTVCSYGPDVPHEITSQSDAPLLKYFVDFAGTTAATILARHGLACGSWGRVLDTAGVRQAFDNLIAEGNSASRFSQELCTALLRYLVVKIAEALVAEQSANSTAYATYQRCRAHIAAHFTTLRTQAQIARQCHVDPAYLCRLYRRYDHQTPYQYLLRLKMNFAATQLQDRGVLVKQVAKQLGFDDPFHFSRAFKLVFGVSPEAFRRLR